jgi:hypothetical protein
MKRTYHGSCHCGAVKFSCAFDLAAETSRCNCSSCAKSRFWKALVKAEDFTLLQGAAALADYQFGSRTIHHRFCRTCGVKTFGNAHFDTEFEGVPLKGEFFAINVACLDDATDEALASAKVRYENGREDRYESAPAETRHL